MTQTRRSHRRTATPAYVPLTDDEVVALTDRYEQFKADEALAKKRKDEIKDRLIAEMNHRGADKIEWDGGRVTKTVAKKVIVSIDLLSELITPRLLRKVTTRVVDKTLLSAEVQAGTIPSSVVAAASEVTENAPYISVSHGTGD